MAFRPCRGCRFARGGENAGRCWPAPEAGTRGHHYGLGQAAHLPRGGGGGQLHPCRRTAEPQPVGGEPPDLGPRGQPEGAPLPPPCPRRSEERRVGKEDVSTVRLGGPP